MMPGLVLALYVFMVSFFLWIAITGETFCGWPLIPQGGC